MSERAAEPLGYAGKRVIVTGSGRDVIAATVEALVAFGAEVHVVAEQRPEQRDLASFTEVSTTDLEGFAAAARKIGAVVNAVFDCTPAAPTSRSQEIVRIVEPFTIEGAAFAFLAGDAEEASDAAATAVRVNAIAGTGPAESLAWLLLVLNSPRSDLLAGTVLHATAAGVDTDGPRPRR
jgi:NAD(P)-dependent dehydrogenase (short-subunit alcohol dehydrogenase family)